MIALLEDGCVTPYDTIDLGTSGRYKFYDRYLTESHDGLGKVTVKQIMENRRTVLRNWCMIIIKTGRRNL